MTDSPTTVGRALAERDAAQVEAASGELALRSGQTDWTPKQKAALAVLGIKGASEADLAVFMHVCQRTGLDPFAKQIYGIMRREKQQGEWVDKFTIQVGIDGFRVVRDRVADRTGYEVDFEDTTWFDAKGGEHQVWLDDKTPPSACKVVLLKHRIGSDSPPRRFPAVLRMAAYMQTTSGDNPQPTGRWRVDADHQLEKCCEAFATRRGFPNDLGGLYIEEEMGVAEVVAESQQQHRPPPTIAGTVAASESRPRTRKQAMDQIITLFDSVELPTDARTAVASVLAAPDGPPLQIESAANLSNAQVTSLLHNLAKCIEAAEKQGKKPREVLLGMARGNGWKEQADAQP